MILAVTTLNCCNLHVFFCRIIITKPVGLRKITVFPIWLGVTNKFQCIAKPFTFLSQEKAEAKITFKPTLLFYLHNAEDHCKEHGLEIVAIVLN